MTETAFDFSAFRSEHVALKLANRESDVEEAQNLRYRVFYQEKSACASETMRAKKRDEDIYDQYADHLLAIDTKTGSVIGTYRLLRQEKLPANLSFYTESEFDISVLKTKGRRLLELGRSCVDTRYRTRNIMDLMWRGLFAYCLHYRVNTLFGCASFEGTEPEKLAAELSWLHHKKQAEPEWCPKARAERYFSMNRRPANHPELKDARTRIPPLIKGYLRLGGRVGEGCVVDEQFNTIDICIVLLRRHVDTRYFRHYAPEALSASPSEAP